MENPRTRIFKTIFKLVVPGTDSGFTRWNCFFFIMSITLLPQVYAIVFCTTWGVFISFNFGPLLDNTAFPRLAESLEMKSITAFHIYYNFLAHGVPCLVTFFFPPRGVRWWHGVIASTVHLSWGLVNSGGTLNLDKIYIPMDTKFWFMMWTSAVVGEMLAPILIFPAITALHGECIQ